MTTAIATTSGQGVDGTSFASCRMRDTKTFRALPYNPRLKPWARQLRRAGNLAEVLLWDRLKQNRFHGLDFDRQKIIGNYIVDFFCAERRVVVEVDGRSHNAKCAADGQRDRYLHRLGLYVIHVLDADVKGNLQGVMDGLEQALKLDTDHSADR